MRISIVGITGYSGLELVRLIQSHNHLEVVSIHATQSTGTKLSEIYPHLKGICDLVIKPFDARYIMKHADLVVFATPSGIASQLSSYFINYPFPVVDISGDHRLPPDDYQLWYKKEAVSLDIQEQFTYSLPEFSNIKNQKFISNPGCYATAVELALIPLVKDKLIQLDSIIVDAKSGLSGAGKNPTTTSHFVNINNNYITYKLNEHQHIPEILQMLKKYDKNLQNIQFSTSLIPVNRGIISTIYCKLNSDIHPSKIKLSYDSAYKDKYFIRIVNNMPQLTDVIGSNFVNIGFKYNKSMNILTIMVVLDNLIKGASGQALQNINLMYGFDETEGLRTLPSIV
ncbi:N-acetyl-gamma-glutamyl-phosphate reductase [Staphylococcus pasteuri]|uniref:N-acetyl-gamma-glutamyl-phosphate reductase n=1 Tax=Staphylococcus pasteuri TaxID=45972 RepID=UPI002DB90340|nr:N-acetyl-gamma-glutamyl-phosphate reductase [Staphylococcus pasteuri]MEB7433606.1 N-acetyl-gamma-glutamyl-phosphate reductase [Staphylococcus pasteuri]